MIPDTTLATLFNALGHPSRVAIFRYLLARGPDGQVFGSLSQDLGLSPSTLVHHLREMERAHLVQRRADGRSTTLSLDLAQLATVLQDFTETCCSAAASTAKG
jgi:ArsR family transcriptional regulator, arsenate/arsenite/antimonite-responsive transcriptional repressor